MIPSTTVGPGEPASVAVAGPAFLHSPPEDSSCSSNAAELPAATRDGAVSEWLWPPARLGSPARGTGPGTRAKDGRIADVQPANAKHDDPKARALFDEVAKAYKALSSYSDQGEFVVAMTVARQGPEDRSCRSR